MASLRNKAFALLLDALAGRPGVSRWTQLRLCGRASEVGLPIARRLPCAESKRRILGQVSHRPFHLGQARSESTRFSPGCHRTGLQPSKPVQHTKTTLAGTIGFRIPSEIAKNHRSTRRARRGKHLGLRCDARPLTLEKAVGRNHKERKERRETRLEKQPQQADAHPKGEACPDLRSTGKCPSLSSLRSLRLFQVPFLGSPIR